MNKTIFSILFCITLFSASCTNTSIERVSTGVKNISKCCNSIKSIRTSSANIESTENQKEVVDADLELRPVFEMDRKMIFW